LTDASRADAVFKPNPDVLSKRLGQDTVLVHIATNRIFELNETGTRVWELLGQGLTIDRITHHLIEEFNVEATQAAGEVKELIVQLRAEGLLAP
jgi:Coenzyme PQQ synthesis protein D (PqqD)